MPKEVITMGIDSSSTNCGIAVFKNGTLTKTENIKFDGCYDLDKLTKITKVFQEKLEEHDPSIVIMEKPAPVRNSKALTSLNQVAGALWALALVRGVFIDEIHNKVLKKLMDIKTKEDSMAKVKELYGIEVKTDHESDAVLAVAAYKLWTEQNGKEL
jgi:Holliday junction resolvasome RuvABC endonuclease subunit